MLNGNIKWKMLRFALRSHLFVVVIFHCWCRNGCWGGPGAGGVCMFVCVVNLSQHGGIQFFSTVFILSANCIRDDKIVGVNLLKRRKRDFTMGIRVNWARKKKVVMKETEGKVLIFVSLTWKCRWFQNGEFLFSSFRFGSSYYSLSLSRSFFFSCSSTVFPQFSESKSIFIFWVHPRDAVSYEFCMYNFSFEYFRSGLNMKRYYLHLMLQLSWDSFFSLCSVFRFLVSMRFVQIFVWMVKSFLFSFFLLSPAAFEEKTVTNERFVLEHDILHGHIVLYVGFMLDVWFRFHEPKKREMEKKKKKKTVSEMKHMAISMGIYEQWNVSNRFHFVLCSVAKSTLSMGTLRTSGAPRQLKLKEWMKKERFFFFCPKTWRKTMWNKWEEIQNRFFITF